MLVHGKHVNRRASKAGLVSHAATSSPLPSITPLYMLAIAGLQAPHQPQPKNQQRQYTTPTHKGTDTSQHCLPYKRERHITTGVSEVRYGLMLQSMIEVGRETTRRSMQETAVSVIPTSQQ